MHTKKQHKFQIQHCAMLVPLVTMCLFNIVANYNTTKRVNVAFGFCVTLLPNPKSLMAYNLLLSSTQCDMYSTSC